MNIKLEICAGSYRSALAALNGGADRVELCSGLDEGGLTPSAGLIKKVCALNGIKKHVLIRPRGGDFHYTTEEKEIILDDIRTACGLGADGIVVGALHADGCIDEEFLNQCVSAANGRSVTFHRAFDLCRNPLDSLEQIIKAGCHRILTSGQAATAEKGTPLLQQLVSQAQERIIIMPGCGVNPDNARDITEKSGAKEIHASCRSVFASTMKFRHEGVQMGKPDADEYAIKDTDVEIVRQLRQNLDMQ